MQGLASLSGLGKRASIAALLLAVAWLAALPGCTMLRVGYGQLDVFALYRADDYFDLDAQQRQEFTSRFERLHEWHRREQLPDYAAFLGEAQRRIERGVAREDVAWMMAGVEERYRALIRRGADDAAALLLTVTPQQLDSLRQRWDRDNRQFVREHRLDGAQQERRAARARRMLTQIEGWTGSLIESQEQRVVALVSEPPSLERLRHAERMRRQKEFLALMELRGDRDAFTARLRHWLASWEEGRTPEQARQFREAREKRIDIYLAVAQTLTPAQRTHLAGRVQNHIGDLTRLAGR